MNDMDPICVRMDLASSPDEVYRYWTEPERYRRWMGRTVRLEPNDGGEYFVQMNDGFAALGTFISLEWPHRLEFTWGWAPGAGQAVLSGALPDELLPPGSSRVRVLLEAIPDGTALRLEHFDLPDETLRSNHLLAWRTYLARLAVVTSGGEPGPEPH